MSFEFPSSDNNLDKKTNEAILKAKLESDKSKTPEKNEMDEMQEIQEEIAEEVSTIGEGVLSKFPPKLKKFVLMTITGASLFFSGVNTAEAGRNDRPHHEETRRDHDRNYSDIINDALEGAAKEIIIETTNEVLGQGRRERPNRREHDQRHYPDEQWRYNKEREYRKEMDNISRRRIEVYRTYQYYLSTARSHQEARAAKDFYIRESNNIDDDEREIRRKYYGHH